MEFSQEATLAAWLLQSLILMLYVPLTYILYQWVHAPMKQDQVRYAMSQLGITEAGHELEMMKNESHLRYYLGPLITACLLIFVTYSLTHPYVRNTSLKIGLLEEVINVYGLDDPAARIAAVGRPLFWGFIGAWVYSFVLTLRRVMDYDLTPRVYIFTSNRFLLAFVVGSIVGVALGTFQTGAGLGLDINLATVSVISFFIGFFPEQGINWITATAQKTLMQQGGIVKETHLGEIKGLSIWQQGRLKQEGLENVQNLATADIPKLVTDTPFSVKQIVDWVDQAILMLYTIPEQREALARAGVSRASGVLANTNDEAGPAELAEASGLKVSELKVLRRSLETAINLKKIVHFRHRLSQESAQAGEAAAVEAVYGSSMAATAQSE